MKPIAKQSFAVSTAVATALLAAQNFAIEHVEEIRTLIGDRKLNLIVAAGIAAIAYKTIVYVYQQWGWRLFNKEIVLSGRWRHRLVRSDTPNDTREGEFEVLQDMYEIHFVNGTNRGGQVQSTSRWESRGVIKDPESKTVIWVVYEIRRNREPGTHGEASIDNGLLRLRLVKDERTGRVVKLEGEYMDAGRSERRGTFVALRA